MLGRLSSFVSNNWHDTGWEGSDSGDTGTLKNDFHPWSNGDTAGRARMGYHGPAGPDEYWLEGASSAVFLPLALTSEGIPLACGGGLPPFACYGPGLPATLFARLTRLTGDCDDLAGDFALVQTSPTTWSVTINVGIGTWTWELECRTVEWSVNAYFNAIARGTAQYPLVTVEPFLLDAGITVIGVTGLCSGGTFDAVFKTTPFV
jgi:hypothetical protein